MSGNIRSGGSSEPTPTPTATPTATATATVTATPEEGTPQPEPTQGKTYSSPPEMTIDTSKQYFAVIETDKGNIRLELFAADAPQTVNNFVFLAREGFYDGLTFYRLVPDFVAQAGDPTCTASQQTTCTGEGGPGYTLPDETNDRQHVEGSVAMAEDRDTFVTNGSQFFIALQDLPQLDALEGHNTVFAQVADEGSMAVVLALTPRDPNDPNAPPGDEILSVTIEESDQAPPTTE